MSDERAEWIDRPDALARFADRLAGCDRVALDTEANSLFAYRERTCILQLTAGGRSAIIDALAVPDLSPIAAALDRDGLEIVLHGGDYDIATLTRDHRFRFRHVFDTMIAATLLAEPKVGLADLVHDAFGAVLDKKFQKCDWGGRPVTDEQLRYLEGDTIHLLPLRDRLHARLVAGDLIEEAEIEFARLARRQGAPVALDPDGWRRIKGADALPRAAQAVLRELHRWREGEAERRDVPPFKVMPPQVLHAIARDVRAPVRDAAELRAVPPALRRRHGRALVAAVEAGLAAAARGDLPAARPRDARSPGGRRAQRRHDLLRDWRRREAERRGVPPVIVLPNPAVAWLAQEAPRSADQLAAHPDIGPKRARRYAGELLALLAD
jgi:ribonuclease D